jgi:hypothetical protein
VTPCERTVKVCDQWFEEDAATADGCHYLAGKEERVLLLARTGVVQTDNDGPVALDVKRSTGDSREKRIVLLQVLGHDLHLDYARLERLLDVVSAPERGHAFLNIGT